MAKLRVLGAVGPNTYRIVVQETTPTGTNSAGISWADAIRLSGNNTTILTVGTGAGQITTTENTQIANGTLFETETTFGVSSTMTATQRNAALDAEASRAAIAKRDQLQADLRFFGIVRP